MRSRHILKHTHTKSTHIASYIMLFEALIHIFLQIGVFSSSFCFAFVSLASLLSCASAWYMRTHFTVAYYYYLLLAHCYHCSEIAIWLSRESKPMCNLFSLYAGSSFILISLFGSFVYVILVVVVVVVFVVVYVSEYYSISIAIATFYFFFFQYQFKQ